MALADAESRVILFSIIRKGKTASDLSVSLKIPLSSVYKKLSDLENLTLIRVEKTILSEKGRRFKVYRSRINKAEISIKKTRTNAFTICQLVIMKGVLPKPTLLELDEYDINQRVIGSAYNYLFTCNIIFDCKY